MAHTECKIIEGNQQLVQKECNRLFKEDWMWSSNLNMVATNEGGILYSILLTRIIE